MKRRAVNGTTKPPIVESSKSDRPSVLQKPGGAAQRKELLYGILRLLSILPYATIVLFASFALYNVLTRSAIVTFDALMLPCLGALILILIARLMQILVQRMDTRGMARRLLERQAFSLFERYHWRFMINDYEYMAGTAMLHRDSRPALLVLTDRRLLVGSFNRLGSKLEEVVECDRLAIKSVASRTVKGHQFGWLWGEITGAAIQIEIVGVRLLQQLVFREPVSMTRIMSMLRQQPRLRPAKNGVRRIAYFLARKALKRQYVESLFPEHHPAFPLSLLASAIVPGIGQLSRNRLKSGFMFVFLFAAAVLAIWHSMTIGNLTIFSETNFQSLIVVAMIWISSLIDLYVHRIDDQPTEV
jgi:hypothetical protein